MSSATHFPSNAAPAEFPLSGTSALGEKVGPPDEAVTDVCSHSLSATTTRPSPSSDFGTAYAADCLHKCNFVTSRNFLKTEAAPNCEVASHWQVTSNWQGLSWHCPTSYIARARGFSACQRESTPEHAVWRWLESVTWRANLLAEAFVTGMA
jgi:hypothetical protein